MIDPTVHEIDGMSYTVRAPTGRDWLAVAELEDVEKSLELIRNCVQLGGVPAFSTRADVESAPMALLLALDRAVGELMEYPIPGPTSGACAPSPSSSAAA
tara:strand:- start:3025 stop:3324 length:300 start_codon:yes stop_codon:yes gene_type:complete